MSNKRICGPLETRIRTSIGMLLLLLMFWYPLMGIRAAFGSNKPDVTDLWYHYTEFWKVLIKKFKEGKMTYIRFKWRKK